ncbi:MAG: PilZ domain-containing protein [Gammaproteobacteria bacterium]|nr:MAG: PilZ domain-containing protein [Gammaproteobacteria bacterium]RLA55957.1 MAG: PilZ domain-containing protein [Gammaproteobacteria bacterium]HDY83552.1 PilZ domain-containing protein [Halieaceae bacterium]
MSQEKRKHLRLPVESTIFIELVSPRAGSSESGEVAMCKTLEVSRDGLRVGLEREVTVGAILQIGVQLPESGDTLYLAGEVSWCRANEEPQQSWSAGFKLLNAANSDIDRWIALLAEMER